MLDKKVCIAIGNIERVTDFNRLGTYDDWQTLKSAVLAQQTNNSDYAAALRVWHEYSLYCRKYGLDCGGDFPRWAHRLNAEIPHCA